MRWKLLLRPGWLAATVAVFTFGIACFTLLAPWQFSRHDERAARNAALQASFASPAKPLGQATEEWSLVTVEGSYLPEAEVVARLRTVQGEPAFEVLTPLRTTGGEIVLVDRGYVRPDNRSQVPPYAAPPTGPVRIEARLRVDETDPETREALTEGRQRSQTYAVDSRAVAKITGLDVRPGYLQLPPKQPGVLGALPLPTLDAGPFLSYALQWIAFGAMALLAWLYFTIRELRPGGALATGETRRKSVAQLLAEDEDQAEAEDQNQDQTDEGATPAGDGANRAGTPARPR